MSHHLDELKERQKELTEEITSVANEYNQINEQQNARLNLIKDRQGALGEINRQISKENDLVKNTEIVTD
tara:strand:+ start:1239 stop:1448 length:210 start_codon:yes stop_codon:yes gene_type:complete